MLDCPVSAQTTNSRIAALVDSKKEMAQEPLARAQKHICFILLWTIRIMALRKVEIRLPCAADDHNPVGRRSYDKIMRIKAKINERKPS